MRSRCILKMGSLANADRYKVNRGLDNYWYKKQSKRQGDMTTQTRPLIP